MTRAKPKPPAPAKKGTPLDSVTDSSTKVVQLPGTQTKPEKKTRNTIDLERMEADYRTGRLTTREVGKLHHCSHARVVQLAKKLGWQRDIRPAARALANAYLNGTAEPALPSSVTKNPEINHAVNDTAMAMAGIRRGHRERILFYTAIAEKLAGELMRATDRTDVLEAIGEAMWAPDQYGRDALNETYMKVIAIPGRIKGLKDLADVLKTLVQLERQAWDLDIPANEDPPTVAPDRSQTPAEHYRWLCGQRPAKTTPATS